MRRFHSPILVGVLFLVVASVCTVAQIDPLVYLTDYDTVDYDTLDEVLAEFHVLQLELDEIYEQVLVHASVTAGPDQVGLRNNEHHAADFEARATALFLHALRLRYSQEDPTTPFDLELEVDILLIKEIYVEIMIRCVVIERMFVSVLIKS